MNYKLNDGQLNMVDNTVTLSIDNFSGTMSGTSNCFTEWPNYCYHYNFPYYFQTEDKLSRLFKIVGKLLEKRIIKLKSVKDFIKLVNEISEIV